MDRVLEALWALCLEKIRFRLFFTLLLTKPILSHASIPSFTFEYIYILMAIIPHTYICILIYTYQTQN